MAQTNTKGGSKIRGHVTILRAFLQFNDSFKIRFFNTYLFDKHRAWFQQHMPRCLAHPGGCSIWLEKVR